MSAVRIEYLHEPRHSSHKRLGRHIYHDERSLAFEAPRHAAGPLKSVTWERHCPVYDQGDLGSCTGNAMAGLLMTGPFYRSNRVLGEPDAVRIYASATHVDNTKGVYPPDDTGSSGLAVCKVSKTSKDISAYYHAFSFAGAIASLSRGPVLIGISWYSGFDSPEGNYGELKISGSPRGGHELYLSSLDIESGYVHGWNSWGPWGSIYMPGMFCMSFGTLKRILSEDGDCTVPQP